MKHIVAMMRSMQEAYVKVLRYYYSVMPIFPTRMPSFSPTP